MIRTLRCEGVRKVGSPVDIARRIDEEGIDEIVVVDCVASLYGRNTLHDVVSAMADDVYCPITVCGGVRSIADVKSLLACGADKVGLNTAAVADPSLIERLAMKFGSSTIVSQIDVKRDRNGDLSVVTDGGRQHHGIRAESWIGEVQRLGAGEIFLTNVDSEGTAEGADARILEMIARASVPVVVSGGLRSVDDVKTAHEFGASGVAMSQFNYGASVLTFKASLESVLPVRLH